MRILNVGMFGLGNVGSGVARILNSNREIIEGRLGAGLRITRALVRDTGKPRDPATREIQFTTRIEDILEDPSIPVVVEVMGGVEPAHEFVSRAIRAGKHVVTANKSLLAAHGEEIFALADDADVDVYFEAAVGGAVPIIRTLREAMSSDRVSSLYGIMNGTSNFILSRMEAQKTSFESALAEAQRLGFAEPDPSMDIDGNDVAQKLSILTNLGFGANIPERNIYVEGIRSISLDDFRYGDEFGYTIRLLGIARQKAGRLDVRVHPVFVHKEHLLASVDGELNAFFVVCDAQGPSMLYGRGAGAMPTGSAIVADLIDVARNVMADSPARLSARQLWGRAHASPPQMDMGALECRYYLRFQVEDRSGVLGSIASVFGERGISLSDVIQRDRSSSQGNAVQVIFMTHESHEHKVQAALKIINAQEYVRGPAQVIRIEPELSAP